MALLMSTLLHFYTQEVHNVCSYKCLIMPSTVSRIVGAYLIKPFNEGDFVQKVLYMIVGHACNPYADD